MAARPRPQAPLSTDRVLHAALQLADESGIEALSMRKLGQRLGVEAMSLYGHVANKEAILDGIVDLVIDEIEVPTEDGDWKAAMRRRAVSAREVLARHPWAAPLMESRVNPGPASLRYYDAVLGVFRRAGFPVPMAAHAFSVLDAYIYGFGLQELSLPMDESASLADVAEHILRAMPADRYPYLAEMIVEHALQPGYSYAAEFEFGLDLILDALDRLLAGA